MSMSSSEISSDERWRSSRRTSRSRRGLRSSSRTARERDRGPRYDDRQRSSLEIPDDEIEIPPFLR